MGYALFSQARKWVEPGYGDCKPSVTAEVTNAIRHHFYNWYSVLSLFQDAVECFSVQRFCMDCNDCSNSYLGVTLPRDFQTVEAMWFNDFPVQLRSSWREFQTGLSPECDCRLQKLDLPGSFATALDIPSGHPQRISVVAMNPADAGKKFIVRGVDVGGRPWTGEFKLGTDTQQSDIALRSIDARGGVIKDQTLGRVILQDETARNLGIYEPDETVPSYRRIKITGLPDNCANVNIRAARRYFPLYGDNDVVETDNQLAFDSMARYLRLYRKADKTRDDVAIEKDHYATAHSMMTGEKSRELGKSTRAEVAISTPSFGRRLNARGRR